MTAPGCALEARAPNSAVVSGKLRARMRFIDRWAPLLVCVREGSRNSDEAQQLATGFEPHFQRGEPYAVLNVSSLTAEAPSARERLQIATWANQARVRQVSRLLCVGSATVVARDWERHALIALQWLWTPVSPHHPVPMRS